MKNKLKTFLFCTLMFALVCAKLLEATPLVNKSISVAELNGTNGIVFINQNDSVYWGSELSYFRDFPNDSVIIRGANVPAVIRPNTIFSSPFNCLSINGINGFFTKEIFGGFDTYKSPLWPSNKYILGVSTISKYGQYPLHLLSYTNQFLTSPISLTSSMWYSSLRCYVTNDNPILATVSFGGDFKKNSYTLFVYSYPTGILGIVLTNLMSNEYTYYKYSNDFFKFIGTGKPGHDMSNVGDTNGDSYDDLLIGSYNNDKCWLVFGGRGWSGEVALTSIDTNGVQLHSLCPDHPVSSAGDMNDDGIDDILYCDGVVIPQPGYYDFYAYHVALVYGRTNWPTYFESKNINGYNGTKFGPLDGYAIEVAGNGDINNDGHEDVVIIHYNGNSKADLYVFYGGPFLKPNIPLTNPPILTYFTGTNGFMITGSYGSENSWANADINGDANGDGFDDILFAVGDSSKPTNYAYLVYGRQSPSAPPALRTPLWINVGESNSLIYGLDSVPTNITWTGCKKGDDYTLCYTNGARCSAWDIPMGELWFTNSHTISSTDDILSVSYTSTNALGPAIGFTTLAIEPMPEPISTGIVVLTTALIGKAILK